MNSRLTTQTTKEFEGQINAFEIVDGRIKTSIIKSLTDLEKLNPIWIDMLSPSKNDRDIISEHFDIELFDPNELTDLEVSERYYEEEKDEIHLHSNFLLNKGKDSTSVPIAFVVRGNILFSVRNEDLPVFRLQRLRVRFQQNQISDNKDLLLDLYDAGVEYIASSLEEIYTKLRKVSQEVLKEAVPDEDASRILANIAEEEELNGLIRGNLLDYQRAISFLSRGKFLTSGQHDEVKEIMRDIESLNTHTMFLSDKLKFIMDVVGGFVNVNQNRRVSQLTMINVIFLPLNIIAGVGGMSEYSMITKDLGLDWPAAYGLLGVTLIVVGIVTSFFLRFLQRRRYF